MNEVGEYLLTTLAPYKHEGDDLEALCEIIGNMFEEFDGIVRDSEQGVGWSILLNLERAPEKFLGWLAQFVGVTLTPGLDDAGKRLRIRETDGFKRGSPGAVAGAARQHLSGTRTVYLTERHGSVAKTTVTTLLSETPNDLAPTHWGDPVNLVMNPSAEINLNGWVANPLLSRAQGWASSGLWAFRISGDTNSSSLSLAPLGQIPVVPGEAYSAAVDINGIDNHTWQSYLFVEFRDANDNWISGLYDRPPEAALNGNGIKRLMRENVVAPPGSAKMITGVEVGNVAGPVETVDVRMDGFIAVKGATVPPYFDGDDADHRWTGPRHMSASQSPTHYGSAVIMKSLREQKPGGDLFYHEMIVGGTYNDLLITHSDYDDVRLTFLDYDEITSDPTKQ